MVIGMADALVSKTSGVTPVPVLPMAIGTGSGYNKKGSLRVAFFNRRLDPKPALMAVVCIVYSSSIDSYYVCSCNDLTQRLKEHNSNLYRGSFTTRATDWEVYLRINDLGYDQARKIESHIKRMKSRRYIENLSRRPGMVEGLKLRYP